MLEQLYNWGDFWIAVTFGGGAVLCFVIAPFIGHLLGWTAPNKDRADYVVRAQGTLISFTALILAFSLVQVQGNLRKTEEAVAKEAGQMDILDRQLLRHGDPLAKELRQRLWDYASRVVYS